MKLNKTYPGQKIIALAGYAGVGKDSVADAIGWPKAAFAKALKDDAAPLLEKLGLDIHDREHKIKARDLLVAYGALARAIDPDHWIKRIDLPPFPVVIISDLRYVNEAKAVEEAGGQVFWILRNGVQAANEEEAASFDALRDAMIAGEINVTYVRNHEGLPHVAADDILRISDAVAATRPQTGDFEYDEAVKLAEKEVPAFQGKWLVHESWPNSNGLAAVKWDGKQLIGRFVHQPTLYGGRSRQERPINVGYWTEAAVARAVSERAWVPVDEDKCGTTDGITPLPQQDFWEMHAVGGKPQKADAGKGESTTAVVVTATHDSDKPLAEVLQRALNSSDRLREIEAEVLEKTAAYLLYGDGGPRMIVPRDLEEDFRNIFEAEAGDAVLVERETIDYLSRPVVYSGIPISFVAALDKLPPSDLIQNPVTGGWTIYHHGPAYAGKFQIDFGGVKQLPYSPRTAVITRDGVEYADEVKPKLDFSDRLVERYLLAEAAWLDRMEDKVWSGKLWATPVAVPAPGESTPQTYRQERLKKFAKWVDDEYTPAPKQIPLWSRVGASLRKAKTALLSATAGALIAFAQDVEALGDRIDPYRDVDEAHDDWD